MASLDDLFGQTPAPNEEEGDVCRVCRIEGDSEEPLIHPCKCSGSVRFVHPTCLKDWLSHSQKKYCEICGHRYTFTKIYTDYIPTKIPKIVFIRQTLLWFYRIGCHIQRFWLAVLGWLIILPSLNLITLRTLVWLADSSISSSSNPSLPTNATLSTAVVNGTDFNATEVNATISEPQAHGPLNGLRFRDLFLKPMSTALRLSVANWRDLHGMDAETIPGFVFRGQILSIATAAVLVGLVFFREWMTQQNPAELVPTQPREEEAINLDDWVVQGGVARRRLKEPTPVKWRSNPVIAEYLARARLPDPRARQQINENGGSDLSGALEQPLITPSDNEKALDMSEISPTLLQDGSGDDEEVVAGPSRPHYTPSPSFDSVPRPYELSEAGPSLSKVAYTAPEMLGEEDDSKVEPRLVFVDFRARDSSGRPYFPTRVSPARRAAALHFARMNKWPIELKFEGDKSRPSDNRPEIIIDVSQPDSGMALTHTHEDLSVVRELTSRYTFHTVPEEAEADINEVPGEILEQLPHGETGLMHFVHQPNGTAVALSREDERAESVKALEDDRSRPQTPDTTEPNALDTPANREHPPADEDDDEDWENEDEVAEDQADLVEADHENVDGDVHPEGLPAAFDAELNEDAPFEREDWDGVFEVVGLIGPLTNLIQNLAFAITIMGAGLTLLVGLPIITGKVVLALDLIKIVFTVCKLFLRGIRIITDPILDIIFEITKDVVLLPLLSSFQALERIVASKLNVQPLARLDLLRITQTFTSRANSNAEGAETGRYISRLVGQQLLRLHEASRNTSKRLATSPNLTDNIWCMLTGYAAVIHVVWIVALVERKMNRGQSAILDTVRDYAVFVKLALFMGVELIVFPLVIGSVINLCTIPLFDGASVERSFEHLRNSPFGVIFVSWLVGTMFMFTFASFLAHIRSSTRKGAMFFIRDPADQNFSPVKDILERSAPSQIKKLLVSAMMYMVVVISIFGVACWTLHHQTLYPILPLRLANYAPLSSVPFDLLYLHLAVPPTLEFLKPSVRGAAIWKFYWTIACRSFCLSSLLHGKRHNAQCQQGGPRILEWIWPILDIPLQRLFGPYDPAGTYARVPAADQVGLLPASERKKGGVFIPLTKEGSPKDDEGKLRLLKQDQRARALKRDPRKDYTVVWLPQYWRTRIHAFIFAAIGVTGWAIAMLLFVPILVGRATLGMLVSEEMHDGYAFLLGGYICCAAAAAGMFARRMILKEGVSGRLRRSSPSARVKRVLLPSIINAYAVFALYFVAPSLLGINFELHVGHICRYGLDTEQVPILHFWDAWAMGCVMCSLLVGLKSIIFERPVPDQRSLIQGVADLLQSPFGKSLEELNKIVMPLTGLLLAPLLTAPVLSVSIASLPWQMKNPQTFNMLLFRLLYPVSTSILLVVFLRAPLHARLLKMRQGVIDAEYKIEERIENYEPSATENASGTGASGVEIEVLVGEAVREGEREDDWEDEE
ncbi:hypothetical protein BD324DRAFT_617907 [Kockovaella imperatae]|uniref:RING-type E3 ubiquitin transferase n=1 Tax=Kockovaella imperatae TaxID=4999 RepID=A0A1Y1ULR3_9TREE|nr:hypothetical protein BD324DRAFT_617907 [Kockovaella imperatae]ORX38932.1 hypothetical protein BD324DRAFT_617907 [Kockovaella imperatae]